MDEQEYQEDFFDEEEPEGEGREAPPPPIDEDDTPWLDFVERYPAFDPGACGEEFKAAVAAGERPTEAYLRIENARLEKSLELLRKERALKEAVFGPAGSTAAEEPEDPFVEGLSYMR